MRVRDTYWICLRIVRTKSTKKYITRMGQYTGTSKACENVQKRAMTVARVEDSLQYGMRIRHVSVNECKICSPKLPFRKTADERPKFIVPRRW